MKDRIKNILIPIYLFLYKYYVLYFNKYKYNSDQYRDTFLSRVEKKENSKLNYAKEIIYVFWTGNNELTNNRKIGLQSLIENSGVEVKLITPNNLDQYIIKEYPLHKGFKYLSLIQKSDYLRCYFMLHHGGGYSDIKQCLNSWRKLFSKLNNVDDKWVLGVRERYQGSVVNIKNELGKDLKKNYPILISNGAFVYKPNSPICKEWMMEIHNRMDYFFPKLIKNPGGIYDENNYPIPWAFLAGHIMHPLILKYNEKVTYFEKELFSIKNYR
ncbi:hypothetical protein ACXR6G_19055 [Ancylomarina sp. YFZ004]